MKGFASNAFLLLAVIVLIAGAGMQNAWAGPPVGSLSGTVLDQRGSGVAGAEVTIKNLDTDSIQHAVTDSNGQYQSAELPAGRYQVSARLANGEMVVLNSFDMAVNAAAATATTVAAQLTATVVVNAQAPLVEKTFSEIDRTVGTKAILELPGRLNLNGLAGLKPGVVPNGQPLYGSPYIGVINSLNYGTAGDPLTHELGSAFAVNGTRPNANYFTIDGSYNMDPVRATNRQSMPPEALQTFNLVNGNFPAEIGRYGGSFVNQISRSGSTGLHGTLMYTWAGNTFNAFDTREKQDYDALVNAGVSPGDAYRTARSVIVDNRAVASAGFPVWKDKVFSFTSWDRDWYESTASPSTLAITPQGLANLQAVECQFSPGSINRLTSVFPVANVPSNRGLIDFMVPGGCAVNGGPIPPPGPVDPPVPLGSFSSGPLGGSHYDRDYWRLMQRVEVRLSDKNSLNLRYLIDDLVDPGFPTALFGQEVGRTFRNHNGQLNDVHIFSPTLVNEFRFSIGRLADRFDSDLGTGLVIGGFNSVGNPNFPQRRKDTSYQFADYLSWSISKHTLKFGGDAVYYRMRANFPFNVNGTLVYPSLRDFLFDENAFFTRYDGDDFLRSNATEIGAFVQDTWRVSKGFTLNLGLRYEYMQIPEGLFSGIRPSTKNFGPRFGFAWAPDAGGMLFEKTTFRGGYSIMYNEQMPWQLLPLVSRNFPRGINTAIGPVSGFGDPPAPITVDDFIAGGGNPDLLPETLVITGNDRDFKTPYYQTWTLGLEREFGRDFVFRAYYVGTKGTHLYTQYDANPGVTPAAFNANPSFFTGFGLQPVIGPGNTITAYRLDPSFGSTLVLDPNADSIYNAGQFSLVKRYSYGIQFGAHYTYSSAISESDTFLTPLANPFLGLEFNRGRSDFDQPHRFVGNYVFVVPTVWRDRPLMSRLVSGWELSGVTTWASGFPFTVYNAQNPLGILPGQNPAVFTQFASFNPNGAPGTASAWFVNDPRFIADPTSSGIVSNLGRNTLRTQKFINTDMALVKNIRTFSEDQSLQFRWEVFNVFNHRSFTAVPLAVISSDTDQFRFLNAGQTEAPGRSMLFTARYFF